MWKEIVKQAAVALVVVALVNKVPALRRLVT